MRFFLIAILGIPLAAYGGRGDKAGTASGMELLIPVGARSIALGGSPVALVSGAEAIYWNPAGIVRENRDGDAIVSHMVYLADIGVDYAALSRALGDFGRIALSVKALSVGDINVTTEDQPDGTGETTSPTFIVAGGTFARHISDRIAVGISSNVIFEKMAKVSATGIAFTAGVQYAGLGGIDGLGVGVVLRNIGPALKFSGPGLIRTASIADGTRPGSELLIDAAPGELPSTIEIGLAYTTQFEKDRINFTSMFENNNFSDDEYKLGIEYAYQNLVFARAGYGFSPTEGEYIYGPSAGVGLRAMFGEVDVTFDYAFRSVKYFSGNHVLTVGIEY